MSESQGKKKNLRRFKREGADTLSLELQERDWTILLLVHEHRFLTSRQIQLLVSGSNQGILRRLQKLFHHGYLDRFKIADGKPIVYGMTNQGIGELGYRYNISLDNIDWTKKNREIAKDFLTHTLMIVNFRVVLTLALKIRPEAQISLWLREGEYKDEVSFMEKGRKIRIPIIPDSSFVIEEGQKKICCFLEADRSTMPGVRFLNKLRGYFKLWQYIKSGNKDSHYQLGGMKIQGFRVLTITKSQARKENLRSLAKMADDRQSGFEGFWFACDRDYNLEDPQTFLKPIWQTPKDDAWHELLE